MENQNPPQDPINRVPEQPENVVFAKNFNVNAAEHPDNGEEKMIVILQAVDGENGEYTVALPLASRFDADVLIEDLKRMQNLIWPSPGESHADTENGESKSVDSPAPYGTKRPRFNLPAADEPDKEDPV